MEKYLHVFNVTYVIERGILTLEKYVIAENLDKAQRLAIQSANEYCTRNKTAKRVKKIELSFITTFVE